MCIRIFTEKQSVDGLTYMIHTDLCHPHTNLQFLDGSHVFAHRKSCPSSREQRVTGPCHDATTHVKSGHMGHIIAYYTCHVLLYVLNCNLLYNQNWKCMRKQPVHISSSFAHVRLLTFWARLGPQIFPMMS